ncbi:hypothetical protein ACET3X_000176 [Alternaria dauci]|uniref:Uncharacterized protein n=1 Tax=Alternaria dauci TaxID=48095 RepID=A0ABR3UW17_9PLEO
MSGTERIDGLLGDLQQLTEAGRDRILGFLPQDDLIALLKAALRERDQDRETIAVQSQLYQEIQMHQSPHVEPNVHVARGEPDNATNQAHTAASPQNRKRTRIDDSPIQVAGNNSNSVVVKQQHETVNLLSDDEGTNSNNVVRPEKPIKREESPPVQSASRIDSSSAPVTLPNVERTQTVEYPVTQTSSRNDDRNGLAGLSNPFSAIGYKPVPPMLLQQTTIDSTTYLHAFSSTKKMGIRFTRAL